MLAKTNLKIKSEWPVWYFPQAPLGSAVKYLASLSADFSWIGIFIVNSGKDHLGPEMGSVESSFSEIRFSIKNSKGKTAAHLSIKSSKKPADLKMNKVLMQQVEKVVQELGELLDW